jgi:hypothetical protein
LPHVKKSHLFVLDALSEMISRISHPNTNIGVDSLFKKGVGMDIENYWVDGEKSVDDNISNLEETSESESDYSSDVIVDDKYTVEELKSQTKSSSSCIYSRMNIVKSKRDELKLLFSRLIKPLKRFFVCKTRHIFRTGWEEEQTKFENKGSEENDGTNNGNNNENVEKKTTTSSMHEILRKFHYRVYSVEKKFNKV